LLYGLLSFASSDKYLPNSSALFCAANCAASNSPIPASSINVSVIGAGGGVVNNPPVAFCITFAAYAGSVPIGLAKSPAPSALAAFTAAI
jgi:hypothetical protein